jgi:chromosome segregation ATPase
MKPRAKTEAVGQEYSQKELEVTIARLKLSEKKQEKVNSSQTVADLKQEVAQQEREIEQLTRSNHDLTQQIEACRVVSRPSRRAAPAYPSPFDIPDFMEFLPTQAARAPRHHRSASEGLSQDEIDVMEM